MKKTIAPPSLRTRMHRGLRAAAVHTRLCRRQRAVHTASILSYHSVVDGPMRRFVDPARRVAPEAFDRHCAWLAKNRNVVSLTSLVRCLRAGGRPEPGSVVITFDGGYLDNAQIASPILARYGLPATVFLATDSIGTGAPFWGDRLYTAFRMRRRKKVELCGKHFDLTRRPQELAAYQTFTSMLMACDTKARVEHLDEIESRLGAVVRLPRLTLTWKELEAFRTGDFIGEFGIQGAAGLDLSSHGDDVICEDLARAVNTFDRELGEVPRHMAFPFGRSSEAARNLVIEMGLQSAVVSDPSLVVEQNTDVFGLPRVDAGQSLTQLAFWTAGGWRSLPARRERAA